MKPLLTSKDTGLWVRLAGTLLAVVLLVLLLRRQDWGEIRSAFQQLEVWRIAAALLLTLLSRLAITFRWHILLHSREESAHFRQSFQLTFAGLFASNFLPTTIGGDVVRLAGGIQMKMDSAAVTVSLIADRLIGMTGMALASPWGIARLFQVGLPALAAPLAGKGGMRASGFILAGWNSLREKIPAFMKRMKDHLSLWIRHPRAVLFSLGFTLLHMAFLFSSIWLLLDGMGERVPWMQVAGIWSLVYFITLLPISINGYGLQEISTTVLYARLGSMSIGASLSIALLIRTLQIAASLPGAAYISTALPSSRTKKEAPTENKKVES
jgi:uncharacterized membrane protein YbhN (UPF0104 family)